MLKNISSLGKTLNKEQQQSINGGAPTPWDHPQNQQCTQGDQKCDCWTSCGTGENENTNCLCDDCKGSFFNCE